MAQIWSHSRLPWVAASAVPVVVSVSVSLLELFVPSLSLSALFSDADFAVGLGVPILVGYLFRLRYEATSREIFLTCAASSYVFVLAELLAVVGSTAGVSSFAMLWSFVAAAFWAVLGALLIVAGSALGRRNVAKGQHAEAS